MSDALHEDVRVYGFPSEALERIQSECRRQGINDDKSAAIRWAAVQFSRRIKEPTSPDRPHDAGT